MRSRTVVVAAGTVLLLAVATRLSVADVNIDSRRHADESAAWQCPERIVKAAAQIAARVEGGRSVHAEFIDGGARTLDLDVLASGQPRPAFRLRFPPQREASQFMLALFMNDGSSRSSCVVVLPRRSAVFDMEFPLSAFRQALGIADYSDVDYILLVARRAGPSPAAARTGQARVISVAVSGTRQAGALIARCR